MSEKVKGLLVVQSLSLSDEKDYSYVDDISLSEKELLLSKGWPLDFIENKLMGDPTKWWVPNSNAIRAMFRTAGMKFLQSPGHEVYFFKLDDQCQPVANGWNQSEYLAATGKEWKNTIHHKTGKKIK